MSTLRVLTYNIHGGRGLDGAVDLARIAEVIAAFAPDLVGLQEVDLNRSRSGHVDQATELARRLGLVARFASTLEAAGPRGPERYGIATLTRQPAIAAAEVCLPWRATNPRSEPRCALVTRVAWAGLTVDLINTHLSIRFGERLDQVQELLRATAPALGEPAAARIVVGDLNCTPWSRPFRALTARPPDRAHGLRAAASPASWPAALPLIPLDHILIAGRLRVARAGRLRHPRARRASDHAPVFAELVAAEATA